MLWVKAFHIIAVVCWFAAIFYLPRLFVYHAMSEDTASIERFKIMERKLYRGIMTPSMIATVILGLWLISYNVDYYMSQGWLHAKLSLVVLLIGFHFYCGHLMKQFRDDMNTKSDKFFRVLNEVPVFALVAIVILAVVRPF
ncbi:protoporphyrinogen oxidase HemJ [Bermanella marisrubri]|uniref:Protoporphyrinogen IX oxidase n=1 Tax=Bermanella marisrubri TaxID=207949 RepID=Q1MXR0_9GAMM|nr:protoporphyrinogen oxidase HemJ [Bermanella marisrubri]EAT10757.1 predicted membrane protein [Oceanobacter sp. RED65] [Bermanella marisrubri]QIZ83085.1 protoporphyrinogen oxidase HemJ [Bermanella marisrubri]